MIKMPTLLTKEMGITALETEYKNGNYPIPMPKSINKFVNKSSFKYPDMYNMYVGIHDGIHPNTEIKICAKLKPIGNGNCGGNVASFTPMFTRKEEAILWIWMLKLMCWKLSNTAVLGSGSFVYTKYLIGLVPTTTVYSRYVEDDASAIEKIGANDAAGYPIKPNLVVYYTIPIRTVLKKKDIKLALKAYSR